MQVSLEDTRLKIIPSQKLIDAVQNLKEVTKNIAEFQKIRAKITQSSVNKAVTPDDVETVKELSSLPKEIQYLNFKFMKIDSTKPYLTIPDLYFLKQHLSDGYLHELLAESEIYVPQNPIQERNPALEKRCKVLRQRQQNDEYRQMTKNVDCVRARLPEDTISYQIKEINKQLIAVAQFIISVLAGFAFGFIGVELIIGSLDFGFRLLLGVMCALIIALAEIYFLAKKLNELNDYFENAQKESAFPKTVPTEPSKAKPHQD